MNPGVYVTVSFVAEIGLPVAGMRSWAPPDETFSSPVNIGLPPSRTISCLSPVVERPVVIWYSATLRIKPLQILHNQLQDKNGPRE